MNVTRKSISNKSKSNTKYSSRLRSKTKKSYTPTINKQLVSFKSVNTRTRSAFNICNKKNGFQIHKQQLLVKVNHRCLPYTHPLAIKYLLKHLSINKHIKPFKIIPPKQINSNCWFNTLFVILFVSDKGRKFFHFFRQLMIEGKQVNGKPIEPVKLRDAFAMFNYAIEVCLTGDNYGSKINTNSIISTIYKSIPKTYEFKDNIPNVNEGGNPFRYYACIIRFLNNNDLHYFYIRDANEFWHSHILKKYNDHSNKLPHFIILEFFENNANRVRNKPTEFHIEGATYTIDSSVIREASGRHFSATLTCEGNEYGFDGLSFHRLVPLKWKKYLNENHSWNFSGSEDFDKTPLDWNFCKCYQMLVYYRSN